MTIKHKQKGSLYCNNLDLNWNKDDRSLAPLYPSEMSFLSNSRWQTHKEHTNNT